MLTIPDDLKQKMVKQHYALFGKHSAAKLCHWTKSSLLGRGVCYKQKFYGVQSHRCLQMTPDWPYCNQKCLFCWRDTRFTIPKWVGDYDDPEFIVEESIKAQRKLLVGYYGLPGGVDRKKLDEAQNPKHVAISLAGEPTLYPAIGELVEAYHKKGMKTFIVSNATLPEVIENMTLPTQLYISLDAPTKEIHKKLNVPLLPDSWERINRTIDIYPSLDTRKDVRITLVKGYNMEHPELYAKLLERSETNFVEIKAYMAVGWSRERLGPEYMPTHEEVRQFALKINEYLGYELLDESPPSRVVLLWDGKTPPKIPNY